MSAECKKFNFGLLLSTSFIIFVVYPLTFQEVDFCEEIWDDVELIRVGKRSEGGY